MKFESNSKSPTVTHNSPPTKIESTIRYFHLSNLQRIFPLNSNQYNPGSILVALLSPSSFPFLAKLSTRYQVLPLEFFLLPVAGNSPWSTRDPASAAVQNKLQRTSLNLCASPIFNGRKRKCPLNRLIRLSGRKRWKK